MTGSKWIGLLAASAVLVASPALVAGPAAPARPAAPAAPAADEHYARGVRAFNAGKFQDAADELEQSIAQKPTAKAALYLGNAYLELGQLQKAKESFALVLKLEPNHPKKVELENLIRSIEARTEVKLHLESTPPGATISVDDEAPGARGTTPADLSLTVGKHAIVLTREGYAPETREVVLKAGEPASLSVALSGKGCEISMTARGAPAARASLDGGVAIQLPAKLVVKAGAHQVSFSADTFETKVLPLSCDGFAPGTLEATLTLAPGKLAFRPAPGTLLKVDGKVVTASADEANKGLPLAPGRHTVSVTVGDEPERTTVIDVRPGETISLGVPNDAIATARYPVRALYVQLGGGANLALRDWRLGGNAFRAQDGSTRLTPGSSWAADVRLGFQISARFAAEMEVMGIALPNELDTSKALALNANLLFHVLPTTWTPILEAGGGFYQVVSGKLGSDFSPRGHLGVGVRGRLGKRIALRLVARDVVSKGFATGGSNNLELLLGVESFIF